jgi:hypothetical protein
MFCNCSARASIFSRGGAHGSLLVVRVQSVDETELLPPESPQHPLPLPLQVGASCPQISS